MRAVWALMMMTVAFAGCAEDAAPPAATEDEQAFAGLEAKATDTTGVIRGIVYDGAIVPINAVNVTIDSLGVSTVTNEQGAFVLSDLDAGTYFVTVEKLGYNSTQTTAVVEAGVDNPPVLKIQMNVNPSTQPFVEAAQFDGFIMCSNRFIVIGLATCSAVGVGDDDFVRNYNPSFRPHWIQSELVWSSTQAAGRELSYSITCLSGSPCPNGQLTVARHEDVSPLLLQVNQTTSEQFLLGAGQQPITIRVFAHGMKETDIPEEDIYETLGIPCLSWPVLFDGCIRFGGAGMVIDQQFTGYTHMFNKYSPPADWRFTSDGAPPGA